MQILIGYSLNLFFVVSFTSLTVFFFKLSGFFGANFFFTVSIYLYIFYISVQFYCVWYACLRKQHIRACDVD